MNDEDLLRAALRALEEYEKYTRGVMIPATKVRGREVSSAITERLRATSTTHPADGAAVER